jgi:monooxygenase
LDEDFVDVLIVGAGISGISAAYHIQRYCSDLSYAVVEARDAVGGTWDLFRYPGIRSDSDMYTFGYAFRPWTDKKVFADGPSILEYVRATASEYGMDDKIRFSHRVVASSWDSRTARWTVEMTTPDSERSTTMRCRFLLICAGYYRYDRGHMPQFPGQESFGGTVIHPQHWPEEIDYKNKNVVVIGSGATAITLVPAMANDSAHVTMLQRSPSYIAARPSEDAIAGVLRAFLPSAWVHTLIRTKNIVLAILFYEISQRWPTAVKRGVMSQIRTTLGDDFDVDTHFAPRYNPWDQRFCLAPDGDFFEALKDGSASVVTDHIDHFDRRGIVLKSGDHLDADIVISATGLELQLMGGVALSIDGEPYDPPKSFTYRGMMISGVPNLALALGYTNSSWTLKVDLTCRRVCRLLRFMGKHGHDICVPVAPDGLERTRLLGLTSGYVERSLGQLPNQGTGSPWRTYQNYIQDMLTIRFGALEDGAVRFSKAQQMESEGREKPG